MFALLSLLLSASSCALLGSDEERYFGDASMSDAARAARDDSTKHRTLDVGDTWPAPQVQTYEGDAALGIADQAGPEVTAATSDDGVDRWVFGAVAGGGALGGAAYDGYGFGGIDVGAYPGGAGRWRVDVAGTIGGLNFTGHSLAGQAYRNEVELALDISGRYYLTPAHTFVGAYPLAGIRFGTLFWDYANPVSVVENGRRKDVRSDFINHFSIYGGAGVSLVQLRHLQMGAHLTAGVRFYGWDTDAGF